MHDPNECDSHHTNHDFIYKILTVEQWNDLKQIGTTAGAPIDLQDGYIHFSTSQQTMETLQKHFFAQEPLVLLQVPVESCQPHLRWEISRNQQLFPHLYDQLSIDQVRQHWNLSWDSQLERHNLPF